MSIAEKKMKVMQFLMNADDEITGELMEFTKRLSSEDHAVSKEDVLKYESRVTDFGKSGEKGLTKDESLVQLSALLK